MLTKLMTAGKCYIREMELEDVAALKFGLISLGTLIGLSLPKRSRKPSAVFATLIFLGTCIPLTYKFIASLTRVKE